MNTGMSNNSMKSDDSNACSKLELFENRLLIAAENGRHEMATYLIIIDDNYRHFSRFPIIHFISQLE